LSNDLEAPDSGAFFFGGLQPRDPQRWFIPIAGDGPDPRDTRMLITNYYFNGRRVIDAVGPNGRGLYSNKTREELEAESGTLTVMDRDAAMAAVDQASSTGPEEITQEAFIDALECLPPRKWQGSGQGMESFRISEPFDGSVHWSFVRIGQRYFKLRPPMRIQHDDLCRMVVSAFPGVKA